MKRIALINDLSGFGKCSLTAAIPVISAMGIQACPLPTAVLSSQTGFDSYFYDDYTDKMNSITDEWEKLHISFDGIASGYLGSARQVENIHYMLDRFKKGDCIFLADPVMGDNGQIIKTFSDELLNAMKELSLRADVITPNLTELCLLADIRYEDIICHRATPDYIKYIADAAHKVLSMSAAASNIIVTGIVTGQESNRLKIGNLIVSDSECNLIDSDYTGVSFSGTGDLFASIVIGRLVQGYSCYEAVKNAVDFLQPAIEDATAEGIAPVHGIHFEKYLSKLF